MNRISTRRDEALRAYGDGVAALAHLREGHEAALRTIATLEERLRRIEDTTRPSRFHDPGHRCEYRIALDAVHQSARSYFDGKR